MYTLQIILEPIGIPRFVIFKFHQKRRSWKNSPRFILPKGDILSAAVDVLSTAFTRYGTDLYHLDKVCRLNLPYTVMTLDRTPTAVDRTSLKFLFSKHVKLIRQEKFTSEKNMARKKIFFSHTPFVNTHFTLPSGSFLLVLFLTTNSLRGSTHSVNFSPP